jgi:hypothetical protein
VIGDVKTPFREAHGSYGFATWDRKPSYEEALHFLRGLARTTDGRRNLRRVFWELTAAPNVGELDDRSVVERLARHLTSGALRVWETPRVAPSASLERLKEEPLPERREPLPPPTPMEPVEPAKPPAESAQAEALRDAAETGMPFCEV